MQTTDRRIALARRTLVVLATIGGLAVATATAASALAPPEGPTTSVAGDPAGGPGLLRAPVLPEAGVTGLLEAGLLEEGASTTTTASTLPLPDDPAAVAGSVTDLVTYEIHTTWRGPGGDVARVTPSVVFVPTPVDVDGDPTTGLAGAEVMSQLSIDAGRATMRVTKLTGAPAVLPLRVEAVVADPRQQSDLRVAFGYDALTTTAPTAYDATVTLVGASRVTSFLLDLHTAGAGSTIGVIAEVFETGPTGERLNPQRGRVDFAPVPTAAQFGGLSGSDLGLQQSGVDLVTNIPTRAEVRLEDVQGDHQTAVHGVIDRVPFALSLLLTDSDSGTRAWDYRANDRVAVIDLSVRETQGAAVVDDFLIRLENMARNATLVQDTPTHSTFQADSPIGVVKAGLATGGEVAFLDATDPAYIHQRRDGAFESLAFRILGLSQAELTTGDPLVIDATLTAGPFRYLDVDGSRVIDARILDLPSVVHAEYSTAEGTLTFSGSAAIGRILVDVTDPDGIADRATELHVDLVALPRTLSFTFKNDGTVGVDAHGGQIGTVDILLTSGPEIAVDSGFDGFVLEDVADHFALAVHLDGLKKASATTAGAPYTASLDTQGGPFLARLLQGERATEFRILDLPPSITVTVDPSQSIAYTGSAPIGLVTGEISDPAGVIGRATTASVRLQSLPPALDVSWGVDAGTVGIDAHGASVGLIDVGFTSGPDVAVPTGFDGVVLEDVTTHYAGAVRLTGLRSASVTTTEPPYSLSLQKTAGPFTVRLTQGTRVTTVNVLNLPSSLTATFDPAGSLSYSGSSPITEINAAISDTVPVAGRATQVTALLRSLPASLDVTWGGAGGAMSADAKGATLGLVEFLATSGPVETIPANQDGVILRDLADRYVLAGRISGLKKVTFAQGPPPSFSLATVGGRVFSVAISTQKPSGVATISGVVNSLPGNISVSFTSPTTFSYRASGAVNSVTLDAFDPDGISGRATTLHGVLTAMAPSLDASWGSDGTVTLDALGGTIGQIELQLTSGPDDRLDPSRDGLLLNDLTDRYVVFARLTGLQKVVGRTSPAPDLEVRTTGNRVLQVSLNQWNGSKVEYTRATLDRLPSYVRVRFVEVGAKQEIFYDASSATNSLVFDTNSGDRWNLGASLTSPLPASVYICQASNSACGGSGKGANAGSVTFTASEHTTLNLFDCTRPLNSNCVRGSADDYIRVDNLRVRRLTFDGNSTSIGDRGHIFLDTDGHTLTGYVLIIDGSTGFEAVFNSGFWAQNRLGEWTFYGIWPGGTDHSGSINCNGSLSVRVFGIWIGVTSFLC